MIAAFLRSHPGETDAPGVTTVTIRRDGDRD